MLFTLILVSYNFLYGKETDEVLIDHIYQDTGLQLPDKTTIQFYHKENTLKSDMIYITARMDRSFWGEFIRSKLFIGQLMIENNNIFSNSDDSFEKWNPKKAKKSISGILNTNYGTVMYLFDINNDDYIIAYFKVGLE